MQWINTKQKIPKDKDLSIITIQDLIDVLEEIRTHKGWDEEEAHMFADMALLNYIGSQDVTNAFNAIDKWYA